MKNRRLLILNSITLLFSFVSSCTKVHQENQLKLSSILQEKIGQVSFSQQNDCLNFQETNFIQIMANEELTIDRAVQIFLINNPQVQLAYAEIGIAQADLIEAGLLSNPIFEGFARYPDHKRFKTNTEISVMQNILDLFLIPLKTKIAAAELQKITLESANVILDLLFELEKTYFLLVASQSKKDLLTMIIELTEIANQLALAQKTVGNINELELKIRTAEYLENIAQLGKVEQEIVELREKFNQFLGLTNSQNCWFVKRELPSIPQIEPTLICLQKVAFNERLDIQAARWEIEHIKNTVPTTEWWAFTNIQGGISSEREPEGEQVTGPQFSASLPIFNFGQAAKKRLFARFKQSEARLNQLEIQTAAAVREAREKLLIFRDHAIFYRDSILPTQEQLVNSTEELYNVMGTSIFTLLDKKRNQLQAYLNYQMALRDYWISRIDLDQAIGGNIGEIAQ